MAGPEYFDGENFHVLYEFLMKVRVFIYARKFLNEGFCKSRI